MDDVVFYQLEDIKERLGETEQQIRDLDLADLIERVELLEEQAEMRDRQIEAMKVHFAKAAAALGDAAEFVPTEYFGERNRPLVRVSEALRRASEVEMKPKGRLPR